ncbi:protein phosphatase [Lithospermum erythrorhizon]|uniref:protein-serine/threonine phosphatase n=1 Tax=Lithospermum erythrorhizon TaxID=34254 RepID=A0AAV3PMD0_LITER
MMAETDEIICQQSVSLQYHHPLCVSKQLEEKDLFDVQTDSCTITTAESAETAVSIDILASEMVLSCSTCIQTTTVIEKTRIDKSFPTIRSGSHTDMGPRRCNEDEHLRIDDLSACLGSHYRWPIPSAFYAVFDGHGGANAASFLKNNVMRFFFEYDAFPEISNVDDSFLKELEGSHRRAFLLADQALAEECSVDSYCGTTAITALVLGSHLLVSNAGDCRAVLCRKGVAVQMSRDHRPTCLLEKKRVEDLGGFIEYGYLNGELAVTRALGDWYMKDPSGSASPLTAEPEVKHILLTDDDEFLIIGCDGIWDVMTSQDAITIVRQELRMHDDPQECARELVRQALTRDTSDNLTAIVVCFNSRDEREAMPSRRPRLRCLNLSEEALNKLRSLLESN